MSVPAPAPAPIYVRWNDAESKFVRTTADDPQRMLVKADQGGGASLWHWLFVTAAGALLGSIVVDAVRK